MVHDETDLPESIGLSAFLAVQSRNPVMGEEGNRDRDIYLLPVHELETTRSEEVDDPHTSGGITSPEQLVELGGIIRTLTLVPQDEELLTNSVLFLLVKTRSDCTFSLPYQGRFQSS